MFVYSLAAICRIFFRSFIILFFESNFLVFGKTGGKVSRFGQAKCRLLEGVSDVALGHLDPVESSCQHGETQEPAQTDGDRVGK